MISVSYDGDLRKLVVRKCNLLHNHRLGHGILQHYPSSRRLNQVEQVEVNSILQLQPSNKHLKEHIQVKYGRLTTLKDIQNMKTKLHELERQGRTDAQITIDKLSHALQSDPNAKGGIVATETNELAVLYYQSGSMGEWFRKFPEILMIDGTYCVNKLECHFML